jgi:hypothetical protein
MANRYQRGNHDIFWPLYCLSVEIQLLIPRLIYVDHCIVCPLYYGFWLPLWYTLAIVLSVLCITASYYPFHLLWPLYCLSFELRLLITHLIYFGHCIVCPLNYGFWLPLWYTLAIVLSVLWITASDYPFDICWPLYCLSFELRLLITLLVSSHFSCVSDLSYTTTRRHFEEVEFRNGIPLPQYCNCGSTPLLDGIRTQNISGDRHFCIGSCKSNYHTITITAAPLWYVYALKERISPNRLSTTVAILW